MMITASLAI